MDRRHVVRQVENATNQCAAVASGEDLRPSSLGDCQACGQPLGSRSGLLSDWDAFPAGVKFDPSDEELLQHLKAEIGLDNAKSHRLISNFISVLNGEDGICQTHPEHLPGVKTDGSSRHFFHRPAKAYTTGTRKRRKIHSEDDEPGVDTRWHKTGKTRPVSDNGRIVGWKKIMVLYKNTGAKKSKPEKTNWILHQYHLGQNEEENEGELVVCKVFYQKQPRQCTGGRQAEGAALDVDLNQSSKDVSTACVSEVSRGTPVTPKVDAPPRLRPTTQIRGAPAQSSKGSELTVLGTDHRGAGASELMSTPLAQKQLNGISGGRMSTFPPYPAASKTMMQTCTPEYSGWNDVVEEVSTSGKSCQNESDNQIGFGGPMRENEVHQTLPFESQLPYQDEEFDLFLHCNEDFRADSYLPDLVPFDGSGNFEEPFVSNPNADYPSVDEILTDTPPALNMNLILSSQEVMDHIYQRPVCTYLDNDDSLSST